MKGQKPKPAALKRLLGNPGKRPIHDSKLKSVGAAICPDWLGEEAKKVWVRLTQTAPWLESADEVKLAGFCQAVADLKWSVETIDAEGYLYEARQGKIPHPANGIKNKALATIAKLGGDLGLDPIARAGIVSHEPPKADSGDEFFDDPPM